MAVMTLTFVITLFISVDLGIMAGLGVSILLVIKNTTTAHLGLMGVIPGTDKYRELDKYPEAQKLEVRRVSRDVNPLEHLDCLG